MPRPTFPYRAGHFWSAQSAVRTVHAALSAEDRDGVNRFPFQSELQLEPQTTSSSTRAALLSPFTTSSVYRRLFML